MDLLKRQNWWIWLLLFLFGQGVGTILLGAFLDVFEKDAWYTKWYYWVIGALCLFFPFFIMLATFYIQTICAVALRLNVAGKEIYTTPYIWILCLIVPVIGWALFLIMLLYLEIDILIQLYHGEAEQYVK